MTQQQYRTSVTKSFYSTKCDEVERRFVVEKTIQIKKDGPKYLLCEEDKKTSMHFTYPYGWTTDNIPADDLEKAVKLVLNDKMAAGAASNLNTR